MRLHPFISQKRLLSILKKVGLVCLILASALIATNTDYSKWSWIVFLMGHISWTVAAIMMKETELLYLNGYFILLDSYGIYRWIL